MLDKVQQVYFKVEIDDKKIERVIVLSKGEKLKVAWVRLLEEIFEESQVDLLGKGLPKNSTPKSSPVITRIDLIRVKSIHTTFYSNKRRK